MIYDFSLCPLSGECLWWCQKKGSSPVVKSLLGQHNKNNLSASHSISISSLFIFEHIIETYGTKNIWVQQEARIGIHIWVGYWGMKQKMQIWTKWNIQAMFLMQSNTNFSIHHLLHGSLKTPNKDTMWEIDVKLMVVFSIYKTKMKKTVL